MNFIKKIRSFGINVDARNRVIFVKYDNTDYPKDLLKELITKYSYNVQYTIC